MHKPINNVAPKNTTLVYHGWSSMSIKVRISVIAGAITTIVGLLTCGSYIYAAGMREREKVTHSELEIRLDKYVTKDQLGEIKEIVVRQDHKLDILLQRKYVGTNESTN